MISRASDAISTSLAKYKRHRITLVIGALIAGLALMLEHGSTQTAVNAPQNTAPAVPAITEVISFVSLSDSAQFFADGMAEAIDDALFVRGWSSPPPPGSRVFFRKQHRSPPATGTPDVADYLIGGAVKSAGDRFHVTAWLVRRADGATLWAHSFDRKLKDVNDVFVSQAEIADAVADVLAMLDPWRRAPKMRRVPLRLSAIERAA